nr:hypothetical protein [Tanacetum cinerariifolium]
MSSPNHPTSDIKDAFSSNSPDYVPASPDYFPTSSGNTSSDSSVNPFGLIPISSPIHYNQAYNLALLSFSVYTPTPPQIFEIGKSSIKMHLKHHRRAPKRTSTSAASAMTQAAIRQLIADSVAAALEAQAATMANTNHTNRNTGPSETSVARKGTNDHKRKYNDRRNTTNNDNNNYPNNLDNNNYPNDRNNNNHCNNRNNNKYQDNHNNNNRNNDYHQQLFRREETVKTYAATPTKNKRYIENKRY